MYFISYVKAASAATKCKQYIHWTLGQGQSNSQKKKNAITFAIYLS